MTETIAEFAHKVEEAVERDVEHLLHPTGSTGPSGPSGPTLTVEVQTPVAGNPFAPMPATGPSGATFPPGSYNPGGPSGVTFLATGPSGPSGPTGPVGAIGGTGPTGLTAAAPPAGHTFTVATTPAGVTFTALLPHPALEPVGTHGTDAHGFPRQPRAEPTASGGTGDQPGDQHQIHNH